jgi:hypothetical protein
MDGSVHSDEQGGRRYALRLRPSRRCRHYMALCASASLVVFAVVVLGYWRLPALPTDFSRTFYKGLNVSLSAELFDLTPLACQRTAFCHHLVLECAPSDDGSAPPGEESSADCQDTKCCLEFPSLAADIQRVYLERLHRQPDSYGIEYYCKKFSSGELAINHMRLRMAASPEGRERSKAARVDDYLDATFGDMPQLLRDLCQAYQSDVCTSANLRQLLLMLYKGQVNVAYVEQVLKPNSALWQTHALTFNIMFTEILCREPEPAEFRENNRLLSQLMTLITTWDTIRDRWKASQEGRWCAYRRRVASHALLLSGGRAGGAGNVAGLSSEGCTLPVLVSAKGGPDSGGGKPGFPKTPRLALYPRCECAPLFGLVADATESRAQAMSSAPHLRNILRSPHGRTLAQTRGEVLSAYCAMLGHLPAMHELSEHLAQLMTWRRSIADVRAMVRGGAEMQYRKLWLDLRRSVPLLAASLHPTTNTAFANGLRRSVAVEALAARALSGEASLQEVASLQRLDAEVVLSGPAARAARRASAFFERTYMQVTGQFSHFGDVLLRRELVSALREGSMSEAGVARAIADTCLVGDACLECAPYSNLSDSALSLGVSFGQEGAADVIGQEAHGDEIAGANPCCCSGGMLRAQVLELFAHDSPQRLALLGSLGNSTMRGGLLEEMHQAFGMSETGAAHMSALVNRRLAPDAGPAQHCIVLYVHNRPEYFKQVLDQLRGVHGIEQALLVVSFDGLFSGMLDVAKTIDFCRVRFLLHTARQTLPHLLSLVAIKEHWWWLVEQVFTAVPETRSRDGFVLFLEEDHVLAPDALTVMSALAAHIAGGGCSRCWGVGLRFGCSKPDASDATGVCLSEGFVNTGYAFNRSFFDILHKHADDFWAFSEGWDYSIFHLIQVCSPACLPPSSPHPLAAALLQALVCIRSARSVSSRCVCAADGNHSADNPALSRCACVCVHS